MGRPKGSKNKPKTAKETLAYEEGKRDQTAKIIKTSIGLGIIGVILLKVFGIGVKTTVYKR